MAADYDKLSSEYESSSSVLIADVDCTVHESLCATYKISGYPTLMYWTSGNREPKTYSGERTYEALKKFVDENLEESCQISDMDTCTEKERQYFDKMSSKSVDGRVNELERLKGMSKGSMKSSLKAWLAQRINVLNQMVASL